MIKTFEEILSFIKNPVLKQDENQDFSYRFNKLIHILFLAIISTFTVTIFTSIFEAIGWLDYGKHAIDDILKSASNIEFLLLAVVLAPLLEELIFRAPLTLFKKQKQFKIAFYATTILFGYMHIFNYDITANVIVFSPFLIGPQLVVGMYLGYIRIQFGLIWSMALHALFNGFLLSLYFIATNAI